jgi:hypothetical protein
MSEFRTLTMVRHPRAVVWETIRDRMPELGALLDNVREIRPESREEGPEGRTTVVNTWVGKAAIPAPLRKLVRPELLTWVDTAIWDPAVWECRWRIEPHFEPERTRCSGTTSYVEAMGGRGTRIVFEGSLDVDARGVKGVPSFLADRLSGGIEKFATGLIPGNFRKLAEAVEDLLAS